ncbi:hypothetical protein B5X24_HaOG206405 [Helicoverpa armigera]|uniref:Uncharacterized protein n=1 Tax=Helicoverpa armigera TaxID=29058 RepID=A0A2W1BKE0_HELAM|nr:hypothetical protein B5X24_HaOG206405 [Helicoverpa armigera]
MDATRPITEISAGHTSWNCIDRAKTWCLTSVSSLSLLPEEYMEIWFRILMCNKRDVSDNKMGILIISVDCKDRIKEEMQ